MALNVDWPLAQSLYQEGVSLKGIAARTGIPYQALHKHSKRYRWQILSLAQPSPHSVKPQTEYRQPCPPVDPGTAARWQTRVLDTASRHLDAIFDKSTNEVDIDELEKLVRVLNATDLTARRTLGLDVARTDQHMTIHLAGEMQPVQGQLTGPSQEVIEVDCVPQQDSTGTEPVK